MNDRGYISWHQVIFPKGPPFSIVTPKTFNVQVRDGLVWFRFSKDTRNFMFENLYLTKRRDTQIEDLNIPSFLLNINFQT